MAVLNTLLIQPMVLCEMQNSRNAEPERCDGIQECKSPWKLHTNVGQVAVAVIVLKVVVEVVVKVQIEVQSLLAVEVQVVVL